MHSSVSPSRESHKVSSSGEAAISVEEWQGWGTTSPIPAMVTQVVDDLKLLQKDSDADMIFGGNHGKLSVKKLRFLKFECFFSQTLMISLSKCQKKRISIFCIVNLLVLS